MAARTREPVDPLLGEALDAPADAPGSPSVLVPLVALGLIASPLAIGAAGVSLLGEALWRSEPSRSSPRPHAMLGLVGLAVGLAGWLPTELALVARLGLTTVFVPLAYAPALLRDPSTSIARALARSIDLTARARARALVPSVSLALALTIAPTLTSVAWTALGDHARLAARLALVSPVAIAASLVGAMAAWNAMKTLAAHADDDARHEARATHPGLLVLLATCTLMLWAAASPVVLLRHHDLGAGAVSWPVSVERTDLGPMVRMQRLDGEEFGVVATLESKALSVHTVDPTQARLGMFVRSDVADVRAAAAHVVAMSLVGIVAVLALLAVALRGLGLRAMLARSTVVRVRIRREDVAPGDTPEVGLIPEGALLVSSEGTPLRAAHAIPVTHFEPGIGACELCIVARGAWLHAPTYRGELPSPPRGARALGSTPAEALTAARLDDLERAVLAVGAAVPLVWLLALVVP